MRQIPACAGMTGVLRGFEDDKRGDGLERFQDNREGGVSKRCA